MPTILAIETSSDVASVALMHQGAVLSRRSPGVRSHSQTLLPMVQALLAEAGLVLSRCDAIAFGAGPGSFTGVRTACGAAQGLAFGAGLPVAPVVTLEALAQACFSAHADMPGVVAMLDARMGEVYWAYYHLGECRNTIAAPALASPGAVQPEGRFALCGNAQAAYPEALAGLAGRAIVMMHALPDAIQVAELGLMQAGQGLLVPPEQAQPLYLRNKVAETVAERAAKAGA